MPYSHGRQGSRSSSKDSVDHVPPAALMHKIQMHDISRNVCRAFQPASLAVDCTIELQSYYYGSQSTRSLRNYITRRFDGDEQYSEPQYFSI